VVEQLAAGLVQLLVVVATQLWLLLSEQESARFSFLAEVVTLSLVVVGLARLAALANQGQWPFVVAWLARAECPVEQLPM